MRGHHWLSCLATKSPLSRRQAVGEDIVGCLVLLVSHFILETSYRRGHYWLSCLATKSPLSRRQATGEDIDGCLVLLQSHLYLGEKLQERTSLAVLSCYKVTFI